MMGAAGFIFATIYSTKQKVSKWTMVATIVSMNTTWPYLSVSIFVMFFVPKNLLSNFNTVSDPRSIFQRTMEVLALAWVVSTRVMGMSFEEIDAYLV